MTRRILSRLKILDKGFGNIVIGIRIIVNFAKEGWGQVMHFVWKLSHDRTGCQG